MRKLIVVAEERGIPIEYQWQLDFMKPAKPRWQRWLGLDDYTYDSEGNQTTRTERATGKVTTYTWNVLHQMTSAHLPDGTVVTYRYDALGRRVEQSSAAGTARYVNLGANVVAEYDGSNTLRASYVTTIGSGNLPGTPLETNVGGAATYPLLDATGSVTGTTDSNGALTSFAYTAYGVPVGASSGTYAYGTYGYDSATGLYYARARYYDAGSGQFLSEDPLGPRLNVLRGAFTAPAQISKTGDNWPTRAVTNLNIYAADNPVNIVDPSGCDEIIDEEVAYSYSETIADRALARPWMQSQQLIEEIMSSDDWTPDPSGYEYVYRWEVEGWWSQAGDEIGTPPSQGLFQLVVNIYTKVIYHFTFYSFE